MSSEMKRSSLAGVKTSLLINGYCFWKRLNSATSGPELVLNATEKTSESMTSKTWCVQTIHTRSVPRAHSINAHAPIFSPLLDDVVSKTKSPHLRTHQECSNMHWPVLHQYHDQYCKEPLRTTSTDENGYSVHYSVHFVLTTSDVGQQLCIPMQ